VALLWFAAGERVRAVNQGQAVSGGLAAGAAVAAIVVIDVGMLLQYATLSYVVGAEAPASAKAMFELTLLTTPIVSVPLLVLILSVAWTEARSRGLSVRLIATLVAAIVLAGAPFSFAASGIFSPDVQQQLVFDVLVLWLIVSEVARPPA
jgi:hypothetical protein